MQRDSSTWCTGFLSGANVWLTYVAYKLEEPDVVACTQLTRCHITNCLHCTWQYNKTHQTYILQAETAHETAQLHMYLFWTSCRGKNPFNLNCHPYLACFWTFAHMRQFHGGQGKHASLLMVCSGLRVRESISNSPCCFPDTQTCGQINLSMTCLWNR